ncbi:MAG: MotA/TolQ/ExbB proton channel family protein [Porticoccaceae bacterium]
MNNPYGIEAMLSQGDVVIKVVAVALLLMSVASWYVIVVRTWGLLRLRKPARALADFWHARSFSEGLHMIGESGDENNPYRRLAEDGKGALDHHMACKSDLHGDLPLAAWLTSTLRGSIDESAERLQRGLAVLASVGSTAPFIGLFGTVWGIYHALVGIGVSGQASIDKVAGPVGEALIMTAFGLVVAIPAVLGYNAVSRGNRTVMGKLNRFAHELHSYLITGATPAKARSKTKEKVTALTKPKQIVEPAQAGEGR